MTWLTKVFCFIRVEDPHARRSRRSAHFVQCLKCVAIVVDGVNLIFGASAPHQCHDHDHHNDQNDKSNGCAHSLYSTRFSVMLLTVMVPLGSHAPIWSHSRRNLGHRWVSAISLGDHRVKQTPVNTQCRIIESNPKFVRRVVVAIDQIPQEHVAQGSKAMGHPGRDEEASVLAPVQINNEGRQFCGRAHPEVSQYHTRGSAQHVPIVRLMKVVVQANE